MSIIGKKVKCIGYGMNSDGIVSMYDPDIGLTIQDKDGSYLLCITGNKSPKSNPKYTDYTVTPALLKWVEKEIERTGIYNDKAYDKKAEELLEGSTPTYNPLIPSIETCPFS